jgi:hypothetical protein
MAEGSATNFAVVVMDKIYGGSTVTIKNLQLKICIIYHGNPAVQGNI